MHEFTFPVVTINHFTNDFSKKSHENVNCVKWNWKPTSWFSERSSLTGLVRIWHAWLANWCPFLLTSDSSQVSLDFTSGVWSIISEISFHYSRQAKPVTVAYSEIKFTISHFMNWVWKLASEEPERSGRWLRSWEYWAFICRGVQQPRQNQTIFLDWVVLVHRRQVMHLNADSSVPTSFWLWNRHRNTTVLASGKVSKVCKILGEKCRYIWPVK